MPGSPDAPLTPRRSSQRLKKQHQDLQQNLPAESQDGRLELDAANPQNPAAKSPSKAGSRLNGRQKTLFVIILALLIDLLAFTIILPLFPRLLKYYEANEAKVPYRGRICLSVEDLEPSMAGMSWLSAWKMASASIYRASERPPSVVHAQESSPRAFEISDVQMLFSYMNKETN